MWNKSDLASPPTLSTSLPQLAISTKTGEGIHSLKEWLTQWMQQQTLGKSEKIFLVSSRHHTILQKVQSHLLAAQDNLSKQLPLEIVALELRQSLEVIGNLSGSEINESVLGEIFSRFCIGK